jgi:hypothetical protein
MRLRAAKHPVFTRLCAYTHDVKMDQAAIQNFMTIPLLVRFSGAFMPLI